MTKSYINSRTINHYVIYSYTLYADTCHPIKRRLPQSSNISTHSHTKTHSLGPSGRQLESCIALFPYNSPRELVYGRRPVIH